MLILIIYLFVVFILLIFLILMTIYTISLIYSSYKGSPYVATTNKRIDEILREACLKKNKIFVELGSGDGRIVRTAVRKYHVKGIGVDINPLLVFSSRLLSIKDQQKISFRVENIFDTDLTKADYVYLFLMPKLIEKLTLKMSKELKKGAVVISHGFPIKSWRNKLYKKIEKSPFPTYYYRNSS